MSDSCYPMDCSLPGSSVHRIFQERVLGWVAISFSIWLCGSQQPMKIFQEIGIPYHLTCLLWNLYAGQETKVRNGHETTDWFQIRKGICQGCISSPCLFNLYSENVMQNARLDEAQVGIKIAGRNISNLRYARWHHPYGRKRRGIKEPFDVHERAKWKSWLKTQHSKNEDHGIRSHHFMANDGEAMETVTDFVFLGSKITADGDCSHDIKRHLLLGRKVMTKLDCILKSRDITLPT